MSSIPSATQLQGRSDVEELEEDVVVELVVELEVVVEWVVALLQRGGGESSFDPYNKT